MLSTERSAAFLELRVIEFPIENRVHGGSVACMFTCIISFSSAGGGHRLCYRKAVASPLIYNHAARVVHI